MAFNNRIDYKNCCNNCIYNCREIGQIPVFKAYNIIAKLGMKYIETTKYFNLLLLDKC